MAETPSRSKKWLLRAVKLAIFVLVCWGIYARVVAEMDKLQAAKWDFAQLHWPWLAAAGACYLIGLFPCAVYWRRIIGQLGEKPTLSDTLRAYYIGHLGKYVPGKALVVVLRVWLLHGRVPATVATVSVFYETLTMMAVGGLVAGLLLAVLWYEHSNYLLLVLALGLTICSGLPIVPPVFRMLAKRLGAAKADPAIADKLDRINARTLLFGVVTIAAGWFLMGLSLWCTLRGLTPTASVSLAQLPIWTAAVALSLVAGFLSLIPGGFGVREWVLMEILVPQFPANPALAIIAPLVLRLVWLLAELIISGILYIGGAEGDSASS